MTVLKAVSVDGREGYYSGDGYQELQGFGEQRPIATKGVESCAVVLNRSDARHYTVPDAASQMARDLNSRRFAHGWNFSVEE